MSATYHVDTTIEKCADAVSGKNPELRQEGDLVKLSWDEECPWNECKRAGVYLRKVEGQPLMMDKGFGATWNGQGVLLGYLEKAGIETLWWD